MIVLPSETNSLGETGAIPSLEASPERKMGIMNGDEEKSKILVLFSVID